MQGRNWTFRPRRNQRGSVKKPFMRGNNLSERPVMKQVYDRVRSGGAVVDVAEFPEFDDLDEAIAHFGGGDTGKKKILDLVNTQHGTNVKNELRSRYNSPMS